MEQWAILMAGTALQVLFLFVFLCSFSIELESPVSPLQSAQMDVRQIAVLGTGLASALWLVTNIFIYGALFSYI